MSEEMIDSDQFLAPVDGALPEPGKERAIILPCPFEATVSYQAGTAQGPEGIIKASQYIEETDEETSCDLCSLGFRTVPELPIQDLTPEEMVEYVKDHALKYYEDGKFVLALGGEHTISVGAAGACFEKYPDAGLLHLDAHHDLRLEYWGSKYSHACVVRRLIELYNIPVASIGIRAFCPDEKVFKESHPVPTCYGWECAGNAARAFPYIDNLPEKIYITLDVDALDPTVMPATGTPEPQGLSYREVVDIIKYAAKGHTIVGADVVELSPRPGLHHADYAAAKLAVQLLMAGLGKKD